MTERRLTLRVRADNARGTFRLLHDVEIEEVAERTISVMADERIPRGERMLLRAVTADGVESELQVRAVHQRAVITADRLRHHVILDVDTPLHLADPASGAASPWLDWGRTGAAYGLLRNLPVRLIDVSTAGCSFESPASVAEGAVGVLSMQRGSAICREVARVCRSGRTAARPWPWVAGVEFLTLEIPSAASIRQHVQPPPQESNQ
jgi:hypothetical protein